MSEEFVTMRHEGVEGTATATRRAFDVVWSELGWEEVSPHVALAVRETGRAVSTLNQLRKDELVQVAAASGVVLSGTEHKDEIIQKIEQ